MTKRRVNRVTVLTAGVVAALAVLGFAGYFWIMNNVEQPKFATVTQDGSFEVRDYPALIAAEVSTTGDRRAAVRQGFRPLASYIFAKERNGEKISMTAPVTQKNRSAEGGWSVQFIMPSKFTLETLPKPAGKDVQLVELPPRRMAVVRFSGVASDDLIAEKQNELRRWIKEKGFTPVGTPTYAYYNHPSTPGFMRRNEVLFEIASG